MGRWLLRGGGSPRAWDTTLVQEWLCLISREPLLLGVLLSSGVWEKKVLVRSGSLGPCPWEPAQPMQYPKGRSIKTHHPPPCPSPSLIDEIGWMRKKKEKLPTAETGGSQSS